MNSRLATLCTLGAVLALPLLSDVARAHPGGLNAEGCHNNRKTGDYHCHRAPLVQRHQPAASTPALPASAVTEQPRPGSPTCHTGPRGGRYTITKTAGRTTTGADARTLAACAAC